MRGCIFAPPCNIAMHDLVYRPTEFVHIPDNAMAENPDTDMVENPYTVINGVSAKETLKELESAYEALGKAIKLMKETVE